MKNHLIISLLILSVGFSQRLSEVIETYDSGNIKSIKYHKKTRDRIEKVKFERYYENGQKEKEGTYKDGEKDGLWTYWNENGQKKSEVTYKDGEFDGLSMDWYENGQKSYETTWKDGKVISHKRWNEDGSVRK